MGAIILGGVSYAVRAFTIGQLETILPLFARAIDLGTTEGFGAAVALLAAALGRQHAALGQPDAIRAIEGVTITEITAAIRRVGVLSGLIQEDDGQSGAASPGEGEAAGTPQG
jgi:hypothetical protein